MPKGNRPHLPLVPPANTGKLQLEQDGPRVCAHVLFEEGKP